MNNPFNSKTYDNHPPVPLPLREALKDYPELVDRLQEVLTYVGREPAMSKEQRLDQADQALWALEGRLGSYMAEAAEEVKAAEATGNANLIAKAKAKQALMDDCRSYELQRGLGELRTFFD